jgi:hypothetical protein
LVIDCNDDAFNNVVNSSDAMIKVGAWFSLLAASPSEMHLQSWKLPAMSKMVLKLSKCIKTVLKLVFDIHIRRKWT